MNHRHNDYEDLDDLDEMNGDGVDSEPDVLPPLTGDEAWRAMAEMDAFWLLFPELSTPEPDEAERL